MTCGFCWSSQQHASVITQKNRQQRPLTRLCYENSSMSQATGLPRTEVRGLRTRQTGGFSPRDIHPRGEAYPLPQDAAGLHRPYVAWQCHGLCYENSSMSQATELPRTEVRGLRTRQTGGFSPRDIHPRGEAYPCRRTPPVCIDLMWPGNAMVFAMKIVR